MSAVSMKVTPPSTARRMRAMGSSAPMTRMAPKPSRSTVRSPMAMVALVMAPPSHVRRPDAPGPPAVASAPGGDAVVPRVHQCPRCELRFAAMNGRREHLAVDHAANVEVLERYRYPGSSAQEELHRDT